MFKFVVVLAFVAAAFAAPAQEQETSVFEQAYDLYNSCSSEADVAVCLKLKALGVVDRAARSAQIEIVDGFKIVQSEEAKSRADYGRSLNDIEASLPTELEARDAAINEALMDRAARFLNTHTVEMSFPDEVDSSLGEARGKKKKKKIIESLKSALSLLKLKALLLIPITIVGMKLLIFKALVLSKIAFILSVILAVKKFLEKKNEGVDIAHEPAHHHDEHHNNGWGRGLDLAYSAYKPHSE